MKRREVSLLIIIVSIVSFCQCILLPVSTNKDRCMIVYSSGEDQTVKIQIDLPLIPGNGEGDHYLISVKDTQTNQMTYDTVAVGKYKKELALNRTVIYEVCVSIRSRAFATDIQIGYQAASTFYFDQTEIKIPESLLKSQDLKEVFNLSWELTRLSTSFKAHQDERSKVNDQVFAQTTQTSDKLIFISVIELAAVVLAGLIQFWIIKNHLSNKQYI